MSSKATLGGFLIIFALLVRLLNQLGSSSLLTWLSEQLHSDLQHSINSIGRISLSSPTYRPAQNRIRAHAWHKISTGFLINFPSKVKTCFILGFPDCPTYSINTNSMKFLARGQPFSHHFRFLWRVRNVIRSKGNGTIGQTVLATQHVYRR